MGFDKTSGLVFREETARQPRHTATGAATHCLGRRPEYVSPAFGSERLVDIAMRKVLCSLDKIDSISLETIPVLVLEKIWRSICRSHLNSLQVWQAFAQSQIGNRSFVRTFPLPQVEEITFNKSFPLITSASFAWITHLTISTTNITAADLMGVSTVTNICKLYVNGSGCTVSPLEDRVMRAWAEAAVKDGAFSQLDSMLLWAHEGVTRWSLERLNTFPKLVEFCAYECGLTRKDISSAASLGWHPDRSVALARGSSSRDLSTEEGLDNLYVKHRWQDLAAAFLSRRSAEASDALGDKPLLHAGLGHLRDVRKSRHWLIADDLLWLHRSSDAVAIQTSKGDGLQPVVTVEPSLKKRRVKARNQVQLDELFYE